MTPSSWFTIKNEAGAVAVEIVGPIRAGDAPGFIAALPPSSTRTIRLHVSSLGGDPVAAATIAGALRSHPARVEARISRICASAATLLPCAANHVRIESDAAAMIHAPRMIPDDAAPPLTVRQLRKAAGELERIRDQMASIYGWRLKGGRDAIARLVDDESGSWFDASECITLGLADAIAPADVKIAAHFDAADLARLGAVPVRFRSLIATLGRRPSSLVPEEQKPKAGAKKISIPEMYDVWNGRLSATEIYARNQRTEAGR